MTEYSRQCVLVNVGRESKKIKTSWIPEKFAVRGKILKLKENGEWEDGWEVVSVGSRLDSKAVNAASQYYKKHRQGTDI